MRASLHRSRRTRGGGFPTPDGRRLLWDLSAGARPQRVPCPVSGPRGRSGPVCLGLSPKRSHAGTHRPTGCHRPGHRRAGDGSAPGHPRSRIHPPGAANDCATADGFCLSVGDAGRRRHRRVDVHRKRRSGRPCEESRCGWADFSGPAPGSHRRHPYRPPLANRRRV